MQFKIARLGITHAIKRKIICSNCGHKFFGYNITICKKCIDLQNIPPLTGVDRTREIVRIRDKHTCQKCKKKWKIGQRRFDVHHLYGECGKKSKKYDKVSEIKNLITLCHKCHMGIVFKKIKL